MAEGVVSFLVVKLNALLQEEGRLLGGLRREVEDVRDELENVRSFLRSADARQEHDYEVRTWVEQLRDLAYDAEDCIDDFTLVLAEPHRRGRHWLSRLVRFLGTLRARHQIAHRMQDIKTRALQAEQRSSRYSFARAAAAAAVGGGPGIVDTPRMSALYAKESQLVGIDGPREELLRWLTDGSSQLSVTSVLGMGGMGKTTLVRRVFESQKVRGCFQVNAWITVSQSFETKALLTRTIRQLSITPAAYAEADTTEELVGIVRTHLENKRYVVVLDDVWSVDAWECLRCALPEDDSGSRIMVTTRIGHVASVCAENTHDHVCRLQPLPPKESWELFCKKVFGSSPENGCPQDLKDLAESILKRCGGLPLAIVTVGGLLLHKPRRYLEWKKLHDSLGAELESGSSLENVKKILDLSFNDLPFHLKACFLYFCIFPEGASIKSKDLQRLWIAEGFVKEKQGMTLEEVAEDYLNELVNKSMIMMLGTDCAGRIKFCQIHDLMRDAIVLRSIEENFATSSYAHNRLERDRVRRLSIHGEDYSVPEKVSFSGVRSLFAFRSDISLKSDMPLNPKNFPNMRLLRVLHLEDVPLDKFPREITRLLHLKFLSLRYTDAKGPPNIDLGFPRFSKLPKSIGNLRKLEVLDLRGTSVVELPTEVTNLQQLRHLLVYNHSFGVRVPQKIGSLKALQKLTLIDFKHHGDEMIRELGKLTQLKSLDITNLTKENSMKLCLSIEKMSCLRSIKAESAWTYSALGDQAEPLDLHYISAPPLQLQRLSLSGPLEKLPNWFASLQNVTRIVLQRSRLDDDPFKALQTLPNLVEIHLLYEAYMGKCMYSSNGGFPRLRILEVTGMEGLELMRIEEEAMPNLEKLTIRYCWRLNQVPLGIEHLKILKELYLVYVSEECTNRLQSNGGDDHWRVSHIPLIHHETLKVGGLLEETP